MSRLLMQRLWEKMQTQAEGIIYATVCLSTGKIYVGIHTKGREDYLGSGTVLQNAIKKYGRQNFVRETVETFETLEKGLALERFWIRELNSKKPNGYNLCDGGEGTLNPCDETRDKMRKPRSEAGKTNMQNSPVTRLRKSLAQKGKSKSAAHKKALSVACIGRPSAFKGRKHSEATRRLQSIVHRGRVAWNKGLTKETDERVKQYVEKLLGKSCPAERKIMISNSNKGKHAMSDENKAKLSARMLDNAYCKGKNIGNTAGKANKGKKYMTKARWQAEINR